MEYQIRLAKETDAKAVHDIYGAYVPLDYVTFTVENPDIESYRRKITTTLEKYPFLIAEDSTGKVLGYVYGSALRPHDAYQWNVEWTIVLAPDAPKRRGIRWLVKRIGSNNDEPQTPLGQSEVIGEWQLSRAYSSGFSL